MPSSFLSNGASVASAGFCGSGVMAARAVGRLAREHNVLRAKGYLAVAGKPMRLLLQAVGERVRHQFDRPWGALPRQSRLVLIGEQGDIDEAAIRAGLCI